MDSSLQNLKREILSRTDLSQLIGERVKLQRRSGVQVGLCPFHQESGPSFTVYPDHYFCFGCKESGDAIRFVQKSHGLGFWEALRHLAQRAGLADQLSRISGSASKGFDEDQKKRELSYRALQAAQEFFVDCFRSEDGSAARQYLEGRQLSDSMIVECGFGWAPADGQKLVRHLRQRGFADALLSSISLASTSSFSGGGIYSFFRSRLMIPIHDTMGRVIAFGGRILESNSDQAKYKNSREHPLFQKSQVLFGMHRAKDAIRLNKRVLIVEGYMDVFRLWQQGFGEGRSGDGNLIAIPPHAKSLPTVLEGVYGI
jgi:DNA primase